MSQVSEPEVSSEAEVETVGAGVHGDGEVSGHEDGEVLADQLHPPPHC